MQVTGPEYREAISALEAEIARVTKLPDNIWEMSRDQKRALEDRNKDAVSGLQRRRAVLVKELDILIANGKA